MCALNDDGEAKFTAYNFLRFLEQLNIIFLQDMAAMVVLHPGRTDDHPLCQMIPCLKMEAFRVSLFFFVKFVTTKLTKLTYLIVSHCSLIYRRLLIQCGKNWVMKQIYWMLHWRM